MAAVRRISASAGRLRLICSLVVDIDTKRTVPAAGGPPVPGRLAAWLRTAVLYPRARLCRVLSMA